MLSRKQVKRKDRNHGAFQSRFEKILAWGTVTILFAWLVSRAITIIAVLLILMALLGSFSVVDPGNTGVVFNIWTGSLRSTGQGLVWRLPWITRVQSYPTALRTYTMVMRSGEGSSTGDDSIDLPTKEGQHIRQDISITYNTSEAKAAQVFKAFRGAGCLGDRVDPLLPPHHHHHRPKRGGPDVLDRNHFIQKDRFPEIRSKPTFSRNWTRWDSNWTR